MPGATDFDDVRSRRKIVPNYVTIAFRQAAGETMADAAFFIATQRVKVIGVKLVQAVAGSDPGAVTAMLERLSGTQAVGSGTALMDTAFDLKGTANTVQDGDLVASESSRSLNVGNRLALDVTGTTTAVAGVVVEVELEVLATA